MTAAVSASSDGDFIRYVEFDVPTDALERAMQADIESEGETVWVDVLAALACQYGGAWTQYEAGDLDAAAAQIEAGETPEGEYFDYYREAYGAVLDGLLGDFSEEQAGEDGAVVWNTVYGLRAFCPIAAGFSYSESDDFGASRS